MRLPVGLLRLLTPLGLGVLLLGAASVALASWLHWQEFSQLAVVALLLLGIAVLWQVLPGTPSVETTLRPARVVEGGPRSTAEVRFRAGAAPMLFPRVSVPVGRRTTAIRLPFLTPFADHAQDVPLPEMPRGVHRVGPVTFDKTDPVGLISRRVEIGRSMDLLVAPRVVDLAVFAGGLTNDLDGATSQQLSMSDLAFHALREYVPGDDLRHVHWRSSAKAGELLVRQYHETRRGHVTVLVDNAEGAYSRLRDFELAVSVATSIALRAVRDDFDTYLRCGEHLARGRSPVSMTDAACLFVAGPDDYAVHASDAAGGASTGLVVQVTGARRELVQLDVVAHRFGRGADRIVVRADSESPARLHDTHMGREISVPDLDQLRELMARGIR